jgi:metallo-beta-lactamase class B
MLVAAPLALLGAGPVKPIRTGAALAKACEGRDGWSDPAPPARLFGNVWMVGTCGITVLLVTGPQGNVLIDGGPGDAAPLVLANIRAAGFDPRSVKWILSTHEHEDHAGALPALKAATGARVAVGQVSGRVLHSGQPSANDPQFGLLKPMAPLAIDRVLTDGSFVAVGPLRLTAHMTPAHSPGSTSWTWRSCAAGECRDVAFADSATTISADAYRFRDHPQRVAEVRLGLARIAALPCDLLITPHPAASDLFARLAGERPLASAGACKTYAAGANARFEARLASEK